MVKQRLCKSTVQSRLDDANRSIKTAHSTKPVLFWSFWSFTSPFETRSNSFRRFWNLLIIMTVACWNNNRLFLKTINIVCFLASKYAEHLCSMGVEDQTQLFGNFRFLNKLSRLYLCQESTWHAERHPRFHGPPRRGHAFHNAVASLFCMGTSLVEVQYNNVNHSQEFLCVTKWPTFVLKQLRFLIMILSQKRSERIN